MERIVRKASYKSPFYTINMGIFYKWYQNVILEQFAFLKRLIFVIE